MDRAANARKDPVVAVSTEVIVECWQLNRRVMKPDMAVALKSAREAEVQRAACSFDSHRRGRAMQRGQQLNSRCGTQPGSSQWL